MYVIYIYTYINVFIDRYGASLMKSESVAQTVKNRPTMRERPRFDPSIGKIPWRRKWQLTPVLLSGEFHGQRTLGATIHGVAKSQT